MTDSKQSDTASQGVGHDANARPDDSILKISPPVVGASTSGSTTDPSAMESSYVEAATMNHSRAPDDAVTEEAVREHLKDIESSFLPTLSPIATRTATENVMGAYDTIDTYGKREDPKTEKQDEDYANDVGHTTSSLENLDSSPTTAAAARTISRAVSMASHATMDCDTAPPAGEDEYKDDNENAFSSGPDDPFLQSQIADRLDTANTSGNSLRIGKRSKYLRSRYSSHRSSASSLVTDPESQDGSEATIGHGADYALQSGGAVPALGIQRSTSNPFQRSISIGSMLSGFGGEDLNDLPNHHLDTLPEDSSPDRPNHDDPLKTPKASRENWKATAPTDTVIAQHVKNVQVPESLAKEYRIKNNLQTPHRPSNLNIGTNTDTMTKTGRNLTLKEQSSTIERLSKENFDLKLKVMFLSDRLDRLSEEGIKEMISENVELKTNLAVLQRDNKILRKRIKELEKQARDEDNRPGTASSTDQTSRLNDADAYEREQELIYLRERVEEYATEIERLRNESLSRESEKLQLVEMVKTLGERSGNNVGVPDESAVWSDLLEQETVRREQADEDNRKIRDEIFRLKKELSARGNTQHTTNIYNISKKRRDGTFSPVRAMSGLSGETDVPESNVSGANNVLVDELRRESEHLRHENAELRREVGAQTSMLTSRNREKERLYQEIEDLKMAQRRGGHASSTVDSIFERSASRAGGHERSQSRGSGRTRQTLAEEESEREELENKLAELRDKISEVKLQNQELQRELESCMVDFEVAVEGKRQAEDNAMSLQEELDTAMNDLVALQAERDEAVREQGEMEHEFEALRHEAQEEIDALEAEADHRNEEIQRAHADLKDRSENFDALQEEMRKMSEALVRLEDDQTGKLRRIQQLEEELDSSNKELEELEQKLMEANEKNQRFAIQQESSQGEIAFLREEQEADKIRIGDLEAAIANAEQNLRDEKDRARDLDNRLQQERMHREIVADREKEEVQQVVDELNREASNAKDEVRRLRKSLSSREVEATEWKERLIELENNLREALGDLNGTRSSLLKSIAKMQRELENTIRELDTTKASLVEKDRIIKQRDALLESHALESRKVTEMLEKERLSHRNTKAQYDTFQRTHQHLTQTASTQDVRIAELESTRGQDRRKLAQLEQTARDQLTERNELLLKLWHKLSALCGREWLNNNTLVDRQVVPSVEVIATRLHGFSKNLLGAVRAIEGMLGGLHTKIKSVERDLHREYQSLENNLEVRTKKLDRLETMFRNSVASGSLAPQDMQSRMARLEDAYRQLKVENATLRTANDVRSRAAHSGPDSVIPLSRKTTGTGSPSPGIPRGPGDRDRSRTSHLSQDRISHSRGSSRSNTASGIPRPSSGNFTSMEVALPSEGEPTNNDNRWLLRLRDMEYKLKMEREGRNQDRAAARQRLGGLELENRDLRERVRRTNTDTE
ncbi:anucleate primary sterigmata protein B [Metarhizium album ARSEF 1941]|uniref:Anucleate primary sterigmata protein B n=1 Tax=Metarhizium album (strain ARSEF 1941) TaxID=1081103 RepID=A0A0B2WWE0_METAS|nr:anucleate primary sterigmata protein B [Metarhizium album ARSEF 1941]KHN97195.1 anucleate primary sterigmata protein B [Metarhizium album ARSEF 1941]